MMTSKIPTAAPAPAPLLGILEIAAYLGISRRSVATAWEEARQRVSPDLPSRLGAFFLFPTKADAELALTDWFKDSGRIPLQVVVPLQVQAHLADGQWLNCPERQWQGCATKYWLGEMSATPRREMVVHGRVYFPGWQEPPFRRLA